MKLKHIVYGAGSVLAGLLGGLVTGGISSIIYLVTRIKLHAAGSLPEVNVSVDASSLNVQQLMTCIEERQPNCTLPLGFSTNLSTWSEPLLYGPAVGASLGVLTGLALYTIRSSRNSSQRSSNEDYVSFDPESSRQNLFIS